MFHDQFIHNTLRKLQETSSALRKMHTLLLNHDLAVLTLACVLLEVYFWFGVISFSKMSAREYSGFLF